MIVRKYKVKIICVVESSREFNLIDFVLNARDILSCIYLVFDI